MPSGEIAKPDIREIQKPQQARRNDGSNRNLFTGLEHSPGSRAYLTRGDSDGRSGDKRIVNTGDLYPLMSGSSSDISHSSPNQESLAPGDRLGRRRLRIAEVQSQIAEVQSQLEEHRNALGKMQVLPSMNELRNVAINTIKDEIVGLKSQLKKLNNEELRLRIAEAQSELKAHKDTLADVGQTLTMTAKKVDELKTWQFDPTENVIIRLESRLKMLNNMEKYINDAKERIPSVESLFTEAPNKLPLEIKDTDNHALNDIFSKNLNYIRLYDLDLKQENRALKAKAARYLKDVESLINVTENTLSYPEIITELNQLKAHSDTLVYVQRTLTMNAKTVDGLKDWKFDSAKNTTIDLADHLEMLNDLKKSISDANDKLHHLGSLTAEDYSKLRSKIEKTNNQDVSTLFIRALDKLSASLADIQQESTVLRMQLIPQLKEIDVSRAQAESNLPETLRNIKDYYRHSSNQARVDSSYQQITGSGGIDTSFEAENLELAEVVAKQNEDYNMILAAKEPIDKAAASVNELVDWITPKYTTRIANEGRKWDSRHSEIGPRDTESIYVQIYKAEMIKNTLDSKLKALDQNRNTLTEEKHKLSSMSSDPIRLYYQALRPEIERMGNDTVKTDFRQRVKALYERHEVIEKSRMNLLKNAEGYIKSIDEAPVEKTKGELAEATEKYDRLLEQKPEKHPFFENEDMIDTHTQTPLEPRGRLFGEHMADVLEAILKMQGSPKTAKDIAPKLDLHPYDGRIGADPERVFLDLEDERTYVWGIGNSWPWRLEKVVSKGAILAILDNAQVRPKEEHLKHYVILDRFKKGAFYFSMPYGFSNLYVVVVDGLRGAYEIRLDKFADAWTGESFSPLDAMLSANDGQYLEEGE